MNVIFTKHAKKDLQRLPKSTAKRIVQKLYWFSQQSSPLSFAEPLRDTTLGTWRFRIGDYRVLCDVEKGKLEIIIVLKVKHRKDIYRH